MPAGRPAVVDDLGGAVPKDRRRPRPGFPSDLMSIALVGPQARGTILMHEKMFDSRLYFVDYRHGGIILCDFIAPWSSARHSSAKR